MKTKIVMALICSFFMQSVFAGVIYFRSATSASGGILNEDGTTDVAVTGCSYTVSFDSDINQKIRVYLTSDEVAGANFNFALSTLRLPLADGDRFTSFNGYEISYSKGILRAQRMNENGKMTSMALEVNADLMNPISGKAVETSISHQTKHKELECNFL